MSSSLGMYAFQVKRRDSDVSRYSSKALPTFIVGMDIDSSKILLIILHELKNINLIWTLMEVVYLIYQKASINWVTNYNSQVTKLFLIKIFTSD